MNSLQILLAFGIGAFSLLLLALALIAIFYLGRSIKRRMVLWLAQPQIEQARKEAEKVSREREEALLLGAATVAEKLCGQILQQNLLLSHALVVKEPHHERTLDSMTVNSARRQSEGQLSSIETLFNRKN